MTTPTDEPAATADLALPPEIEEGVEPTPPLTLLLESARRLSAMIPEEERKPMRARMVAYLDEVAAREPSRQPDQPTE